jgi:hypothetical protein
LFRPGKGQRRLLDRRCVTEVSGPTNWRTSVSAHFQNMESGSRVRWRAFVANCFPATQKFRSFNSGPSFALSTLGY